VTRTGRIIALLGLAGILLTGCAQPGQLGSPEAPPAPPPAAAPQPAPPPGPVLIGSGRVEDPVSVRTPGPAVFSVETVVLAPGTDSGWHRHPGTEMAVVRSGSITVQREDDCAGTRYGTGDAVFVPDAQPHLARNDGDVPAELVVTSLLAPGAPDREDVGPAC
jgi:quercetin dioxygenase-like cupin family protein